MKKDLKYYMSLPFKIEINFIPKEKGSGVEASIPELGRAAFLGYGKSIEEALEDLEETKKENFEEIIKKRTDIPEPEKYRKEYRGEVLVRMPKFLHRELSEAAQENGVSLNQYMNFLLINNFRISQVGELVSTCFEKIWENIWSFPKKTSISESPKGLLKPKTKELLTA